MPPHPYHQPPALPPHTYFQYPQAQYPYAQYPHAHPPHRNFNRDIPPMPNPNYPPPGPHQAHHRDSQPYFGPEQHAPPLRPPSQMLHYQVPHNDYLNNFPHLRDQINQSIGEAIRKSIKQAQGINITTTQNQFTQRNQLPNAVPSQNGPSVGQLIGHPNQMMRPMQQAHDANTTLLQHQCTQYPQFPNAVPSQNEPSAQQQMGRVFTPTMQPMEHPAGTNNTMYGLPIAAFEPPRSVPFPTLPAQSTFPVNHRAQYENHSASPGPATFMDFGQGGVISARMVEPHGSQQIAHMASDHYMVNRTHSGNPRLAPSAKMRKNETASARPPQALRALQPAPVPRSTALGYGAHNDTHSNSPEPAQSAASSQHLKTSSHYEQSQNALQDTLAELPASEPRMTSIPSPPNAIRKAGSEAALMTQIDGPKTTSLATQITLVPSSTAAMAPTTATLKAPFITSYGATHDADGSLVSPEPARPKKPGRPHVLLITRPDGRRVARHLIGTVREDDRVVEELELSDYGPSTPVTGQPSTPAGNLNSAGHETLEHNRTLLTTESKGKGRLSTASVSKLLPTTAIDNDTSRVFEAPCPTPVEPEHQTLGQSKRKTSPPVERQIVGLASSANDAISNFSKSSGLSSPPEDAISPADSAGSNIVVARRKAAPLQTQDSHIQQDSTQGAITDDQSGKNIPQTVAFLARLAQVEHVVPQVKRSTRRQGNSRKSQKRRKM